MLPAFRAAIRAANQTSPQLRKTAYALKNSPTVVTPRWCELCKTCDIKEKNMPRDVRTRWNSTYDMIEFALVYQQVIDKLTSERGLGLRDFEMDADEWEIAAQLSEILKVSVILQLLCRRANLLYSYSKMQHSFSQNPRYPT